MVTHQAGRRECIYEVCEEYVQRKVYQLSEKGRRSGVTRGEQVRVEQSRVCRGGLDTWRE